jgi:hypothetical protein
MVALGQKCDSPSQKKFDAKEREILLLARRATLDLWKRFCLNETGREENDELKKKDEDAFIEGFQIEIYGACRHFGCRCSPIDGAG